MGSASPAPQPRMKRHLFPVALWIVVAMGCAGAVGLAWVAYAIRAPYKGYASPSVLVRIPPGTSSVSILEVLESGGVIRDRRLALLVLKVLHRGRTLKAGEYRFEGARSVEQVVLK